MTEKVEARVKLPETATRGEIIEIKTLITHPMDSGQQKDKNGNIIPRKIINRFTCQYNGKTVLEARLEPAMASNPFFAFYVRATETGLFEFSWVDDDGAIYRAQKRITVS